MKKSGQNTLYSALCMSLRVSGINIDDGWRKCDVVKLQEVFVGVHDVVVQANGAAKFLSLGGTDTASELTTSYDERTTRFRGPAPFSVKVRMTLTGHGVNR